MKEKISQTAKDAADFKLWHGWGWRALKHKSERQTTRTGGK